MNNEEKKAAIKKDQLLSRQGFISHCTYDDASVHTARKLDIDEIFLAAAEKDGFIKPVLKVEENIKQQDGTEKSELVSYYSPFQIYIIAELRENSVLDDSLLWGRIVRGELDFYRSQGSRMMNWGSGMRFSVEAARGKRGKIEPPMLDPFLVCEHYHQFLELLHSFDLYPQHEIEYGEGRMFAGAPSYAYNFDPIRTDGKNLLEQYGLSVDKINTLRWHVGNAATAIDPLERWYYYIARHPQHRKDLLKGDAAIAQELYVIYGFLTKIHEMVGGQQTRPFFEFLHPEHLPYLMSKTSYQQGEDLNALKYSIEQFNQWQKEGDNKTFVTDEVLKTINSVGAALKEFEGLYGNRSYAGNLRRINEKDAIVLEKVDPATRRYVDMILKQREVQSGKKPTETEIRQEIVRAIMSRLGDFQHELRIAFSQIDSQFREREHVAWQEINGGNTLWMKLIREGKFNNLDSLQQRALLRTEQDKVRRDAEGWGKRGEEFRQKVSWYVDVVFCSACRKTPVQLHIENTGRNAMEISRSVICDNCINTKKLNQISQGEWPCYYCGQLLSKFAYNNLLNHLTAKGWSEVTVEVEYGKATIKALCNNCKEINVKSVEWGWLP